MIFETIAVVLGVIIYCGIGSLTFGITRSLIGNKDGFESPEPLLCGLMWPIALTFIGLVLLIMIPANRIGFAFQERRLEKRRQRIALQEKIRVELQEAEKEIEAEFDVIGKNAGHKLIK